MTGSTQGHKITRFVCPTTRQWFDVVYFFGRGNPTLLLATLTERVLRYVSVSDALPCSVVPFPHSRIAVISFITSSFLLGMFFTKPTISQLRTAGMRTRTLRFIGQLDHLAWEKEKPSWVSPRRLSSQYSIRWYNYTIQESKHSLTIPSCLSKQHAAQMI